MKIENPLAFRYILQEDVYLLNSEKDQFIGIETPETVVQAPALTFNYLGGNKKNFLVLVHYSENEFMHEQHLVALQSTLKRLNFEMDDIAVFNLSGNEEQQFDVIFNYFKPGNLMILGKKALPAGMENVSPNKLIRENNCTILYTFSFDQMMDSTENKKIFWEQMKQL